MATVLLACWVGFADAAEPWPLVITAECAEALSKGRQKRAQGGVGDLVLNAQLEF
tara:strand:- start:2157 stop:2321 length:165 start_codon:yes stop_codon:yes gene_type:complete